MGDNIEKRSILDLETKIKILNEKNKVFQGELINLRRELDHKDSEMEKAQHKASQLDKAVVLLKKKLVEIQTQIKVPSIA